jgi:hypothetical protein
MEVCKQYDCTVSAYQHTSAEIMFVPFMSSQYIPTILSSCCKLRAWTDGKTIKEIKLRNRNTRSLSKQTALTGQTSLRISLHVLIGFREMT